MVDIDIRFSRSSICIGAPAIRTACSVRASPQKRRAMNGEPRLTAALSRPICGASSLSAFTLHNHCGRLPSIFVSVINYTTFFGFSQIATYFGPRHRYHVMEQILNEAGAPEVKCLWSQIKKERWLWRTWPNVLR